MASTQNICRICYKQETIERLLGLYDCHYYNGKLYYSFTKLGLIFMDCINIKLISPPDAPRSICTKCEATLCSFSAFKRTAIQTDRRINDDIIANASIQSLETVECLDKRPLNPVHAMTQTELDGATTVVLNDKSNSSFGERANNPEYLTYYLPNVDQGDQQMPQQQINSEGRIVSVKGHPNSVISIPIVFQGDLPQYMTDVDNMAAAAAAEARGDNKPNDSLKDESYRFVNGTLEENMVHVVNNEHAHYDVMVPMVPEDLIEPKTAEPATPNGTKTKLTFFDGRQLSNTLMVKQKPPNLKTGRLGCGLTAEEEAKFTDASEIVASLENIDTSDVMHHQATLNGRQQVADHQMLNNEREFGDITLPLDPTVLEEVENIPSMLQDCDQNDLFQDVGEHTHQNAFADEVVTEMEVAVLRKQSPKVERPHNVTVNPRNVSHWQEKPFSKVEPLPTTAKSKPRGRKSNEHNVTQPLANPVVKRRRISTHHQPSADYKRTGNVAAKNKTPQRPVQQRSISTRKMANETRSTFQCEYEANLSRMLEKQSSQPQLVKKRTRQSFEAADTRTVTSTSKNIVSGVPDKMTSNKKQQPTLQQQLAPPRVVAQMQPPRSTFVVTARNTNQSTARLNSMTSTPKVRNPLVVTAPPIEESLISEYSDLSDGDDIQLTSSDDENELDTRPLMSDMSKGDKREEDDCEYEYLDNNGEAE